MANAQLVVASMCLLLLGALQSVPSPTAQTRPATPLDPTAAILEAFRQYPVVCLGGAHGDRLGEAFQLALIQDPRLPAVVQDIVLETGNSRYQPLVDRFVNGETVEQAALEQVWLDTTQQQAASRKIPEALTVIRRLNTSRPPQQRLRVLLGEPPIEWERMKTADDLRTWEQQPQSDRDWFGADLVRREVLAKKRRALLLLARATVSGSRGRSRSSRCWRRGATRRSTSGRMSHSNSPAHSRMSTRGRDRA